MNVNFELYKVFCTVADEKSISKGANKLNISQPAVSQAIQTLEGELGGKLFIRTPKGVILTNEGKELYDYVKEGMKYLINGTNKFMALKELDEGVLNIGSTTTICEKYLLPFLEKYKNKYPNVQINIHNDLTGNLISDLRNGTLDIVICSVPSHNIKDMEITIIDELNDIFVSKNKFKTKKIKDLLSEGILIQKVPSVTRTNFDEFLKNNNLSLIPKMEVVSHGLLESLVERDFGTGILTKEFIQDKLGNTLYEIKTDKKIPKRKLGYIVKKDIYPSFSTIKFIDILKD
ncbi:MAG: LysR family transcriptional regulator [Bacilli bacterium]|nr:LysR family transcriptional regulator [Bacilli bacterium]